MKYDKPLTQDELSEFVRAGLIDDKVCEGYARLAEELKGEDADMAKREYKLDYRVINHDFNRRAFEDFNVFRNVHVHDGAVEVLDRYRKGKISFDELDEALDKLVMWQEWSRTEYEILIGPWPSHDEDEWEKIDCYRQYHMNHTAAALKVLYDNNLPVTKS